MAVFAFVSDGEVAVAEQPGKGPLDLPAVPAGPFGGLDARRAMRETMPRLRSQARLSAEWYALSARSLPGRLRRGTAALRTRRERRQQRRDQVPQPVRSSRCDRSSLANGNDAAAHHITT